MHESSTRFGARWDAPQRTAAVLRAHAAAAGHEVRDVSPLDAAAAVVGADAWMLVTGATSLRHPAGRGRPAVCALAAVLSRAAGTPLADPGPPAGPSGPHELIEQVEWYLRWCEHHLGPAGADALRRAAGDLAHAPDGPVAALADLFDSVADSAELA